ncbi:hypothetical protein [Aestuariibaculum suncheonense]|uniref:SnoaL-like domain-containing protein n=1 Tax=Aestuariibaculum suncheonense TaxID=1028745 RepID=A0A8J6UHL0_9FLAO|nr:hypothetical protein [Aestuariibaculum suncheonense]MBD0835874.1 hypothetical protein [Aestuariibaculum suncheonense]
MKKLLLLAFFSALSVSSFAQDETPKEENQAPDYTQNVQTIDNIVRTLYDVISGDKDEERNWNLFKFLFYKDAKLIASGKNQMREAMVNYMSPGDYIKNSGKWMVENGFHEREIHRTSNTFGNMSQVFSTFEAFKSKDDEEPFMRGINSIQLYNDGKRWWILNIYWANETRRSPIPRSYLPKQKS